MNQQSAHSVVVESSKAAPPLGVGGLTLMGYPLEDWVLMATLVYTVLQIGFLIRDKIWRHYGSKRRELECSARADNSASD